jgi:hypothetical protein
MRGLQAIGNEPQRQANDQDVPYNPHPRQSYAFNSTSRKTMGSLVSLSTSCSTPALRK